MAGANAVGQTVILDGLNDQGLSFGPFYFPGFAEYPDVTADNAAHAMAPFEFGAWVLGNFATVDELKARLADGVVVNTPAPGFGSSPAHYFVRDKDRQVDRHRAARRYLEIVRRSPRRGDQRARL